MKKNGSRRRWRTVPFALALVLALCPAALADTDGTEPKITQQPDQLILQLGPAWAGVEFELRTAAGAFPAPVVVDDAGILRMDLGGSSTYTLSCLDSTIPAPAPAEPTPSPPAAASSAVPQLQPTGQPDAAPHRSIPMSQVAFFLVVLAIAVAGLALLFLSKRRRARTEQGLDDDDEEL